jgi:hypothetical protein
MSNIEMGKRTLICPEIIQFKKLKDFKKPDNYIEVKTAFNSLTCNKDDLELLPVIAKPKDNVASASISGNLEGFDFFALNPNKKVIIVVGSAFEFVNASVGYADTIITKTFIEC